MNTYVPIPNLPLYSINKNGVIINTITNKILTSHIDPYTGNIRILLTKNNKQNHYNVATLLARTFIPIPIEYIKLSKINIGFKDNDKTNINIDNLYWMNRAEFLTNIRNFNKIKFKVPIWTKENTGYYPNPIECEVKPGYYYTPYTESLFVISKEGKLWNLANDKEQLVRLDKYGYYRTSVFNINKGKRNRSVARLVAMLFCPIPDKYKDKPYSKLMVNHIDGIKTNNHYTNLEWCTALENNNHAFNTRLNKTGNLILARNLDTNEITTFRSIRECARVFMLDQMTFAQHLKGDAVGQVACEGHVFKYNDGKEWPMVYERWGDGTSLGGSKWYVICIKDGDHSKPYLSDTLEQASETLKLSYNGIRSWRLAKGIDVPYHGWNFYSIKDYKEMNNVF